MCGRKDLLYQYLLVSNLRDKSIGNLAIMMNMLTLKIDVHERIVEDDH